MMAMLVEHGYSVLDVASMLDCSASQVRRACAYWRESAEMDDSEPIVVH
jgi:transposase-like protein